RSRPARRRPKSRRAPPARRVRPSGRGRPHPACQTDIRSSGGTTSGPSPPTTWRTAASPGPTAGSPRTGKSSSRRTGAVSVPATPTSSSPARPSPCLPSPEPTAPNRRTNQPKELPSVQPAPALPSPSTDPTLPRLNGLPVSPDHHVVLDEERGHLVDSL